MSGQLTNSVKATRAAQAQRTANEMEDEYLASCIGKTLSVLFETEREGVSIGHADNYTQVCVHNGHLRKLVENVEITSVLDKMLVGKLV